jgi:peptidoglycan/LPS O-acetylase OafA/YrhL
VPLFLLVGLVLLCNVVPADISGWPRLSIHILMALLLASCVIRKEHWLTPILDRNPLRRIGVVSYGIYLYHLFGQHLGNALLSRMGVSFTGALFITSLLITWAGAELSFRLYESPFLRLKDRLSRSRAVPVEETGLIADGQGEGEGAAKPVAVV